MRISDWSSDVCSSDLFQAGLVVGPAIGGVLVGSAGKHVAYLTAAVFAIAASMAVAWLRVTEPPRQLQRAPIFASIAEGARFVLGHQILLGALALDMFAVLFGGAISLAPAFIKERSEARRLGKEGVSPCRSRGAPYH